MTAFFVTQLVTDDGNGTLRRLNHEMLMTM